MAKWSFAYRRAGCVGDDVLVMSFPLGNTAVSNAASDIAREAYDVCL